jgi:hypothetical protein
MTTSNLADDRQSLIDWLRRKGYSDELVEAVRDFDLDAYRQSIGELNAPELTKQNSIITDCPVNAPLAKLPPNCERILLT